jgi:FG-GAP-like repeat
VGESVALSADGNTAIVGGSGDNSGVGAVWMFTRSGGVWSQQGSKLVVTDAVRGFGNSVALSADGNTAIVGEPQESSQAGAAWMFTRSGGVWSQQGPKLVGTGAVGGAQQGTSVALSADGNTAIVGGPFDNSQAGAAWMFRRIGGVWSQQGSKLAGTGAVSSTTQGITQGWSVALSANGNTALIGGFGDNGGVGAVWPFASPVAHDFNGDARSDILWRDTSGNVALWLLNGSQVVAAGALGALPATYAIVGQRGFDGSSNADILWRDTNGNLALWFMNGLEVVPGPGFVGLVTPNWSIYGTGDLNGDGMGDILWRDTEGNLAIWLINGSQPPSIAGLGQVPNTWTIVGDDSRGNIFWHDSSGNYAVWEMNGTQVAQSVALGNVPLATWQIAGLGDFDGDGYSDILWRDTAGNLAIWFLNSSLAAQSTANLGNVPTTWSIAQTGDYNGDDRTDILWTDGSGNVSIWFMNGGQVISATALGNVGTTWTVQSANAE